jgi:hypothetical protein
MTGRKMQKAEEKLPEAKVRKGTNTRSKRTE